SACGGTAEQVRWAARCERFARVHHRAIARLLDYGPIEEGRRFEAWRSDGPWGGSGDERERTRKRVGEWFHANEWTRGARAGRTARLFFSRTWRPASTSRMRNRFEVGSSARRSRPQDSSKWFARASPMLHKSFATALVEGVEHLGFAVRRAPVSIRRSGAWHD